MRATRGKRIATPDLCRVERWTWSNATSSTRRNQRRDVHPRRPLAGRERLQPLAPRREGQGPQVLLALDQDVVEPHEGRVLAQERRRHGLAVEALLEVVEGCRHSVAHDQQL